MNIFTCTIHAEQTQNVFYRTRSIRGTNFIACWAYWEPISSHAEHARKCLKVKYLGRMEYDFRKSRVKCPWDNKDSFSEKKVKKKISCLCTFKIFSKQHSWSSMCYFYYGVNLPKKAIFIIFCIQQNTNSKLRKSFKMLCCLCSLYKYLFSSC